MWLQRKSDASTRMSFGELETLSKHSVYSIRIFKCTLMNNTSLTSNLVEYNIILLLLMNFVISEIVL